MVEGQFERLQNDPGLDLSIPVLPVDLQNGIHPLEVDDDGGPKRNSAAHQAGASPVRKDRHARLRSQIYDGRHFLCRPRAGD